MQANTQRFFLFQPAQQCDRLTRNDRLQRQLADGIGGAILLPAIDQCLGTAVGGGNTHIRRLIILAPQIQPFTVTGATDTGDRGGIDSRLFDHLTDACRIKLPQQLHIPLTAQCG